MKRVAFVLAGSLLTVGVGVTHASVISFTNEAAFLAAAGSTTTENFDAFAAGAVITALPSLGISSVTTDGSSGSTQAQVGSISGLPFPMSPSTQSGDQFLSSELADPVFATAGLNFFLSGTATAVGLWVTDGSPLGGFTIDLFDGAVNIGSFTFGPQTVPGSFVGLTSTLAFNRFFVDAQNAGDSWGLDNLTVGSASTAVPEPTTLVLVGSGLAGGLIRRRRLGANKTSARPRA